MAGPRDGIDREEGLGGDGGRAVPNGQSVRRVVEADESRRAVRGEADVGTEPGPQSLAARHDREQRRRSPRQIALDMTAVIAHLVLPRGAGAGLLDLANDHVADGTPQFLGRHTHSARATTC